ncbi:MAG: PAS domain-containing sensor histidine kinase [Limisphaerales bacterium]
MAPKPLLTQIRQIRILARSEAERQYPVHVQGVVTCYEEKMGFCFIQDSTAGIFVWTAIQKAELKGGQMVDVAGISGAGLFSPIIAASAVRIMGTGSAPSPSQVSIEELMSGSEDAQWVEVRGIVHGATEDWEHWVLDLVSGTKHLKARILSHPKGPPTGLIDARIVARGVAGALFNDNKQLTGFSLYIPALSDLIVLEPSAGDPFSAPVQLGSSLKDFLPAEISGHRMRLQGVVTLQRLGRLLMIKDKTGAIRVDTRQATQVEPGDLVDVAGFPVRGAQPPFLQDAIFRKIGAGPPPVPVHVTADQATLGRFDNELVQFDAQLLGLNVTRTNLSEYLLKAGHEIFEASLRTSNPNQAPAALEPGSRVRVTGICVLRLSEDPTQRSLRVWLRSPNDLALLEPPPWWTLRRLSWLLGLVLLAVVAGLSWLGLLRRRVLELTGAVREREGALEERYRELFDNAADIIYTLDLNGQFTSLNRAGELITGYPRAEALKLNLAQIAAPEQRDLPQDMIRRELAGDARTIYDLEIIAKDGRRVVLSVDAHLEYRDGRPTGVKGFARNITERKQTEEALRFSEQQLRRSLEEQERIARDLHDGVIQSVYAVGLGLEDCRQLIPRDPVQAEGRLAKCLKDLNALIRELRSFIGGLEPEALKGRELEAALKSLMLTMGETHSLGFALQVDPAAADRLNPKQATHLLHIAREAMSNSLRHAQAQTTIVSLRTQNGCTRLEIRDDGIGFDMNNVSQCGHGLRNITARARELQAHLEIIAQPGQGTRVLLDMPRKPMP